MKSSVLFLSVASVLCGRGSVVKMKKGTTGNQRRTTTAPIEKRISWFVSSDCRGVEDFLGEWEDVVDGAYLCCGAGAFNENGTMTLNMNFNKTAMKPFHARGLPVMPTFGGEGLPLKAWENREVLADQIVDWVLEFNFSGVHNDWEAHGDVGVDAYKFYDFWRSVGKKLHTHGKKVGTCIETAPANVSHPWTPRTLNNDTTWHSYMFNWDYVLSLDYMDLVTNMATYPVAHCMHEENCD